MDIFSRKIAGHEVHETESMKKSSDLIENICIVENIQRNQIITHADNGNPLKGCTMLVTLQRLGIVPSFSRPGVSNDHAYSESLFKTMKYGHTYPNKPFQSLEKTRLRSKGL